MPRRPGRVLLAGGLLIPAVLWLWLSSSRADDLGRFLERAARHTLREALEPQGPPQGPMPTPASGPSRAGGEAPHGEPVAVRTADGWRIKERVEEKVYMKVFPGK